MENLKTIIGTNLQELRKSKKLTQAELALQFNYSDKAVSKWETGETIPDVETLNNLAKFYGVTLDYLTHPGTPKEKQQFIKKDVNKHRKIMIASLICAVIWTIAACVYVFGYTQNHNFWVAFIWAIPACCLVLPIFNKMYFGSRLLYLIDWSIFIWSALLAVFFTNIDYLPWPIFLVGIPSELCLIIWWNIKDTSK